ncbi:class I SAM-dependent methyltransferase [Terriglobus sp. RCC_193]|uniref:class I SAM-dependent methyltransferase n=1 Tax=Terriglobus sp. RCC_193 TaxID=3239218 RepID=UPI0035252D6D
MRLFGSNESRGASAKANARIPRPSSGWSQLQKSLREQEGLRILDIGPTSSTNINFLTAMGHSVYMADLVEDVADPKWARTDADAPFPTEDFVRENLDFGERLFDTVLFWDTADYFPTELRTAVVRRIHEVMQPGGQLLAFFHVKPESGLQRYHLRDDGQVDTQFAAPVDVRDTLTNRQIEQLFREFASYKFFLAKDNLREVLVTR